jgi:O-antigen/teichoic acid export membrane protein
MNSTKSSYHQIFKATSLFGGVQVFNILISIVRAKFVAIFLGPSGLGILNLLLIPIGFIGQLTGLGLSYSAVRDISQAVASDDKNRISKTLSVFQKLVWITGFSGALLTLILSPLLSLWTFGNKDYTFPFMFLSITLLFSSLSSGYSAILQGLRKLKLLAKSSVIGASIGLVVSIPLYYFYRINGIVPTLVISAITTLLLNWYFARKIEIRRTSTKWSEVWDGGKGMVKLGLLITLSQIIASLVSYLVNIYISRTGGLGQVGLYQAGFSITEKYVGLIFAAMVTDYYPRLVSVINDHKNLVQTVNHQAEIALLILGPVLLLLLATLPIVIMILYTPKFLPIVDFIPWIILGMPFKAAAWAMGFIILANGHSILYFLTELFANILLLVLNIIGYKYFGLVGLGISFVTMYLFYFILILFLSKYKYNFRYYNTFYKIFFKLTFLIVSAVFIMFYFRFPFAYISTGILFIIATIISYRELNKRLEIRVWISNYLNSRK